MTTDFKRRQMTGRGIPVTGNDIDTDRIIPARFLRTVVFEGLGEHAFEDDRAQMRERGGLHPFDDPRFAEARILLVNKNFGCGSSREHAPQAIMRWGRGIQAAVGESFAEIFFGNCLALGIPCITVDAATIEALMSAVERDPKVVLSADLRELTLRAGDASYRLHVPEGPRRQLVDGTWDSLGELVSSVEAVRATATRLPYFRGYT